MLHAGTLDGILNIGTINSLAEHPTSMPSSPPVTEMSTDSIKNCNEMTGPVAPTAIRNPISLVRSVTLTSMIFMIPIPATRSEKAAATTRMMVTVSMVDDMVSIISACERMVKSSAASPFSLWLSRRICVSSSMAASLSSSVIAEHTMLENHVCAAMRFMTVE